MKQRRMSRCSAKRRSCCGGALKGLRLGFAPALPAPRLRETRPGAIPLLEVVALRLLPERPRARDPEEREVVTDFKPAEGKSKKLKVKHANM